MAMAMVMVMAMPMTMVMVATATVTEQLTELAMVPLGRMVLLRAPVEGVMGGALTVHLIMLPRWQRTVTVADFGDGTQ